MSAPAATELCISADSHITEPPDTYIDRIDPKYKDRAPRIGRDDTWGDVMVIDNGVHTGALPGRASRVPRSGN